MDAYTQATIAWTTCYVRINERLMSMAKTHTWRPTQRFGADTAMLGRICRSGPSRHHCHRLHPQPHSYEDHDRIASVFTSHATLCGSNSERYCYTAILFMTAITHLHTHTLTHIRTHFHAYDVREPRSNLMHLSQSIDSMCLSISALTGASALGTIAGTSVRAPNGRSHPRLRQVGWGLSERVRRWRVSEVFAVFDVSLC